MSAKHHCRIVAALAAGAALFLYGCGQASRGMETSPIQLDTAQMMETAASEMPVKNSITLRERLGAPEKFQ